eukprot:gene11072-18679_t
MAPPVVSNGVASRSQNGDPFLVGEQIKPKRNKSGARRLRRALDKVSETNGNLLAENTQLRAELAHFQSKVVTGNDSHNLEVTRLKKEIEYHKRLRQGSEQRCTVFEEQLRNQHRKSMIIDETQDGLVEQSQLLVSKNAELSNRLGSMDGEVNQLESLNACLEAELTDLYADRDRLAEVLEQIIAVQQGQHHTALPYDMLDGDENEEDDDDDDADEEQLSAVYVGDKNSQVQVQE